LFSYVDKKIREKLKSDHRLVTIDRNGNPVGLDNGNKPYISIIGPIPIPRRVNGGETILDWYPFVRRMELGKVLDAAGSVQSGEEDAFRELIQTNMSVNSVLVMPGFFDKEVPLVRVHSCCMTGDVFGSMRCECGPQLDKAFEYLHSEQGGAVVYMSGHEGRGIGLWAKAVTYLLQDDGQDTYQANTSLGLPEDSRDFTDAAVVLKHLLKGKAIRLLSNNPEKKAQLEKSGQPVEELVTLQTGICEHNRRYMNSKRTKGHTLSDV
jgi:GTP cyclohydrolase II